MTLLPNTPRADGFRMPAEFEPHSGTWMIWPIRSDSWRNGGRPAQKAFAQVAAAIADSEPVTIAVPVDQMAAAKALLDPRIHLVAIDSDDAWMRDVGPTFVINDQGERRAVDWIFNAWGGHNGGLYCPWDRDDAVAAQIAEVESAARYRAPLVMEGGAIHTDGEGTLLVTEECLLNPNRNPHLNRTEIERYLRDYLSVETFIWLGKGCYNDETDGHIDNICCFVRPGEVLLAWTDDATDPQYKISRAAYQTLSNAVDARGRKLTIHKLHQPRPIHITEEEAAGLVAIEGAQPLSAGERLAASYINFYIANRHIVFPLLDEAFDSQAQAVLERCFPERMVVGIPAKEILLGGGNIHCITQQVPAASQLDR